METGHPQTYGDELPAGTLLGNGQYRVERYLNSGGFGVTYLARDSLERRVVIKECFPGAICCRTDCSVRLRSRTKETEFGAILDLFEKEARALAALQHPYIVGVHQFFRENGTAYMAMDFIEGRTLLDVIEKDRDRLTPSMVKTLLMQILKAVSYIHDNDILHRDISPDNILLDPDNQPVLIDFGAAREDATRVSRTLSKVLTVKDGYSPQEFYMQGSAQSYSSDLYALAATFYHVVCGEAPPGSHTRLAAVARDAADPLKPLGKVPGYDDDFIDAINKCLSVFPKDRIASADIWHERIDQVKRQKALLRAAENDKAMELQVKQLVEDFHTDFTPVPNEAPTKPASTPRRGATGQATAARTPQTVRSAAPSPPHPGASDAEQRRANRLPEIPTEDAATGGGAAPTSLRRKLLLNIASPFLKMGRRSKPSTPPPSTPREPVIKRGPRRTLLGAKAVRGAKTPGTGAFQRLIEDPEADATPPPTGKPTKRVFSGKVRS